jgi:hypothetical protein
VERDQRGLPPSYTVPEVEAKAERVYSFVFVRYGGQRVAVYF